MRNNRTAQRKQSSGWWILVMIVGLAVAYALGGVLGPLVFREPASNKSRSTAPVTGPSKLPLNSAQPPSSVKKTDKKASSDDLEVEVIVNKPSKSTEVKSTETPKPKASDTPDKPVQVAEPIKAPQPKVKPKPKAAEPVVVPKRTVVKKPEPAIVIKPLVKPKVKPPAVEKPLPVITKPSLPVQQPTRLDDQTKLPPVTPAAGVYRVMASAHYKSWAEAQAGLVHIKAHVPGADIIKSTNGGYVVQLAQYRVRQNVNKFTSELKQKGIPYIVR
ncbi:MAG: SPOR domain-containing protein [Armatimonadota bacterium]